MYPLLITSLNFNQEETRSGDVHFLCLGTVFKEILLRVETSENKHFVRMDTFTVVSREAGPVQRSESKSTTC